MIDHFTLTVLDLSQARAFYEGALAPLGYRVCMDFGKLCGLGDAKKPYFWLKEGAVPSTPMHIAFKARTRAEVDAFHAAALAHGARDDGAPGVREHYHPSYYGAFVIDPSGHPIEAVCHGEVRARASRVKPAGKKAGRTKLAGKKKGRAKPR